MCLAGKTNKSSSSTEGKRTPTHLCCLVYQIQSVTCNLPVLDSFHLTYLLSDYLFYSPILNISLFDEIKKQKQNETNMTIIKCMENSIFPYRPAEEFMKSQGEELALWENCDNQLI